MTIFSRLNSGHLGHRPGMNVSLLRGTPSVLSRTATVA